MSWQDRVKTDFTIICGDGKSYTPLWLNAVKEIEYNIAEFNFKEIAGTLVPRGTPRGRRFAIELYFQGPDHITTVGDFEVSAADRRPWTITHPYYSTLLVQPVGLRFDNTDYNITKVTGTVIETISTTPDKPTTSAPDKIVADKETTDAALAATYVNEVPTPKVSDVQDMISNASGTYNAALSSIREAVNVEAFTNAFNAAKSAIGNANTNTLGAITAIQTMLSLPYTFAATVASRTGMLVNMLSYLAGTIPGIDNLAGKKLYENNAGTLISALIAGSVTGTAGAYGNRTLVLGQITTLLSAYNTYLSNLNGLQSLNGGLLGAYIPNAGAIRALGSLVSYGVSTLLNIAADSKQERTFLLEEDTNVILLAARLYGMQPDDSSIDALIANNGIGLNELLEIKKGRKIIYYL